MPWAESHRGWELCPPEALPSALTCFDLQPLGPHAGAYSLDSLSAVLLSARGTLSGLFYEERLGERAGCRILPVPTVMLAVPALGPVLGSGAPKASRADGETETGGEMGVKGGVPTP